MIKEIRLVMGAAAIFCCSCAGDTFTSIDTGKVYHGYATQIENNGKTTVETTEGTRELNLAGYTIEPDSKGRKNLVSVIRVMDDIDSYLETEAFEKAVVEESNKGPLFILIEVDSPGGRVDLAKRMCKTITETRNCQTIAYIKGGENGGAYSAGAAISLACDKIYMSKNTVIGAATIITSTAGGKMTSIGDVYGEAIGEKASSGWRNYLAALATQNGRPGLLAKAMENRNLEIVEVSEGFNKKFIESVNVKPHHTVVKTWSKKGSLLTLPADEALECGMADKTVSSMGELLRDLNATTAEVVTSARVEKAILELKKVLNKSKKLDASIDLRIKRLTASRRIPRMKGLKLYRGLVNDLGAMIRLQRRYPDLPYDEQELVRLKNTVQADLEAIKSVR